MQMLLDYTCKYHFTNFNNNLLKTQMNCDCPKSMHIKLLHNFSNGEKIQVITIWDTITFDSVSKT